MGSVSRPVILTCMIVAGVFGVFALPTAISPLRVKIIRATIQPAVRATAIGVILAACGVLVAGATGLPTEDPQHHPAAPPITITSPHPPPTGGTPPLVPCLMTVRGTGRPPAGDRFAVATQQVGTSAIYYESTVQEFSDPASWAAGISFGDQSDRGASFRLLVFEIPASWETYIVTAVDGTDGQNTWWQTPGPPPPPARQVAELDVQRSQGVSHC